jgi:hypothetical protein
MNKNRIVAFLTLVSLAFLFQNFTSEKNTLFPPDVRFKQMNTDSGFYSEEKIIMPMEIKSDQSAELSCLDFNTVTLHIRFKSELRLGDKVKIGLFQENSKNLIQKFEEEVGRVSLSCEDHDLNLMNNSETLICLPKSQFGTNLYFDLVVQNEFLEKEKVRQRIQIESSCLALPQLIELE